MITIKIQKIIARQVLDSRGNPTVEAEVHTKNNFGRAIVPSGASTGMHEALELRDGGKEFSGKGVKKAVNHVNKDLNKLLKGMDVRKQSMIDYAMIEFDVEKFDGKLGANSILAVSMACAKCAAKEKKMPLYKWIGELSDNKKFFIPSPFMNVINGGKHSDNDLAFQEFMINPIAKTFSEKLRIGVEVYHELAKVIRKKYGRFNTNLGDEGGYVPNITKPEEALQLLTVAAKNLGYSNKVKFATDVAANSFYDKKTDKYIMAGKKYSKDQLMKYYLSLIKKYPIVSIEDPFDEDFFEDYAELTKKTKIQIVGDDLTVTNVERIREAIFYKSCNCLLLKVNQIGSLSEAIEAAKLAKENKWKIMVSHRSGETEDTFIADLAVGIGAEMIKTGAPARGERTAKYNQLLRIEEEIN